MNPFLTWANIKNNYEELNKKRTRSHKCKKHVLNCTKSVCRKSTKSLLNSGKHVYKAVLKERYPYNATIAYAKMNYAYKARQSLTSYTSSLTNNLNLRFNSNTINDTLIASRTFLDFFETQHISIKNHKKALKKFYFGKSRKRYLFDRSDLKLKLKTTLSTYWENISNIILYTYACNDVWGYNHYDFFCYEEKELFNQYRSSCDKKDILLSIKKHLSLD